MNQFRNVPRIRSMMRYSLLLLVLLSWSLWFGGTIATFVFGLNLFHTHPAIAGEANSAMFVVFGKYELVLAAVAVLASGLMLISFSNRRMIPLLACLVLATALAMTSGLGITPRMESLRLQGQSKSAEFKKLHGASMMAMLLQSSLLLLGGALLVNVDSSSNRDQAASTSPR